MNFQRIEFACAIVLLTAMVLLIGIASFSRFIGAPIIWAVEISQLIFVWFVMLAVDLTMQQYRHFALDVVLDRLGPQGRQVLAFLVRLTMVVLFAYLFYFAVRNAINLHPRKVGALQLNASLTYAAMPVGLALLVRTLVVQLWRQLADREPT